MLKSMMTDMMTDTMVGAMGGSVLWALSDLGSDAFAFYNMNAGVTNAGSGKISTWADTLGNTSRNISQGTGANRPTLTADGVYFNGSTDVLFNNNPFMLNSSNGIIVIAVISAPQAPIGVSEWILCEGLSSSANPHFVMMGIDVVSGQTGLDTQQIRNDANTVITAYGLNSNTTNAYDDTFKILAKKYSKINNQISLRINGVDGNNPLSFALSGTFTLDRFSLGALVRGTTLNYAKFTLKGLAILDASIGNDDLFRAEGYLAHLYNQTALLPNDHPYKTNPPTK